MELCSLASWCNELSFRPCEKVLNSGGNGCAACSLISNDMTQFILNSDVKEIRDIEDRVCCLATFLSS